MPLLDRCSIKKIKFHESFFIETDRPWVIDAFEYYAPYPSSPIATKNRDNKWGEHIIMICS